MLQEDSMKYIMYEGWFDMASLVAIASCNKQLYAIVDRADHLWRPFLASIKFPQTGLIDDTHWKSPDIPLPYCNTIFKLRVPPRINGGRRDDDSFYVHPRDKQARGRGLVLAERETLPNGKVKFDQTTGILQDRFYGENESLLQRRPIYIPRALPIECKACRVMLDTYPALVSHCKQWSHRQNMDETQGRRVPEEFVDPRNKQSYQRLSVFHKVMALKTFEHNVIAFLRAPMDQDGIDRMISNREWVLNHRWAQDINPEGLLSIAALEKVREASIALVLDDFYDAGMEDSYCLDVILGGWQAFPAPDDLYWYITLAYIRE